VTEAGSGGAQGALAQDAGLGMHDRKRRVVADRAEIAEVIGEALELRHQGRSHTARGGIVMPSAASAACANASA